MSLRHKLVQLHSQEGFFDYFFCIDRDAFAAPTMYIWARRLFPLCQIHVIIHGFISAFKFWWIWVIKDRTRIISFANNPNFFAWMGKMKKYKDRKSSVCNVVNSVMNWFWKQSTDTWLWRRWSQTDIFGHKSRSWPKVGIKYFCGKSLVLSLSLCFQTIFLHKVFASFRFAKD